MEITVCYNNMEYTRNGVGFLKAEKIKMLKASGIFIACILIYNMFSIYIEYFIGTFGTMLLFLTVTFLVGIMIMSIIKIINDKQYRFFIFIVAGIIALTLLTTQTLRFVGLSIDYKTNKNERFKVAEMLRNGEIPVDPLKEYVYLPSNYAYLSRYDGRVMVDESDGTYKTCFFSSGGLYRNQDVVIYISNDEDSINWARITDIKKLDDHWFRGKIVN